eukprot:6502600-Ditylum_brightwellii.AAC.1
MGDDKRQASCRLVGLAPPPSPTPVDVETHSSLEIDQYIGTHNSQYFQLKEESVGPPKIYLG